MKKSNLQKVEGHTSIFLSSQVEENPIESVLARACVFYSTDDKNISFYVVGDGTQEKNLKH